MVVEVSSVSREVAGCTGTLKLASQQRRSGPGIRMLGILFAVVQSHFCKMVVTLNIEIILLKLGVPIALESFFFIL